MRGNRTEVVVERVFADPQGEMKNGESWWVRTPVMQDTSSLKSGQESLWSIEEQEAQKLPSPRKNTI